MADVSLTRRSARELARLIRSGDVSPVEVLDAHLAVIEAINPKLNAIVTLVAERARDAARAAEAAVANGEPLGALHGLPVAIKDITPTAGIRTTFASPLFKDHVPAEDAEVVRRLKAAGAIVLAKTNTPEFACGANTNNASVRPHPQSVESCTEPGGLVRRLGGGGRHRHGAARARHRFRLLHSDSRRVLRHRRHSPDAGADAQRADAARLGSGPGSRRTGPRCRRRRLHARQHGRLEPPVADFGRAALGECARGGRARGGCQGPARCLRRRYSRHRGRGGDRHDMPDRGTAPA